MGALTRVSCGMPLSSVACNATPRGYIGRYRLVSLLSRKGQPTLAESLVFDGGARGFQKRDEEKTPQRARYEQASGEREPRSRTLLHEIPSHSYSCCSRRTKGTFMSTYLSHLFLSTYLSHLIVNASGTGHYYKPHYVANMVHVPCSGQISCATQGYTHSVW